MSTRPLPLSGASAILAAARAALRELPDGGTATAAASVTAPASDPGPPAVAVPARGATPRNTAQPNRASRRTNPRRSGITPRQMMAARLLLSGRGVAEVAGALGVHPYTVSRWKRDPLFDAELRRQFERAAPRNTAQQSPTRVSPPAQNEANSA